MAAETGPRHPRNPVNHAGFAPLRRAPAIRPPRTVHDRSSPPSGLSRRPADIRGRRFALRIAIAHRPELRSQDLQLEQARRDADYFHSQLKPSLGLDVSYGYSGFGSSYNTAFNQITGLDFRGWQVQLSFAYPIQNRSARLLTQRL